MGKEDQLSVSYGLLQPFQCLLYRKRTGSGHNSLDRGRRSRCRWLVHVSHLSPLRTRERLSPSLFPIPIPPSHPHCIIPIVSFPSALSETASELLERCPQRRDGELMAHCCWRVAVPKPPHRLACEPVPLCSKHCGGIDPTSDSISRASDEEA